MRIHHKFASPRVIWTIKGANKETLDNDIIPLMEQMRPGDRIAMNEEVEIVQESVDGNARFIEHVNKIIDEVDSGLQSSANRLITEPSAMADAKEAGQQDDDRVLGIMERIRLFMNFEVIPRITGREIGEILFKWGNKDTFDLEFPEALQMAIDKRVISPEKALIMLEENYHWKIPTDDDVEDKFGIRPAPIIEPEQPEEPQGPNEPEEPQPKIPAEMKTESDNKLKNEKIVFMSELNRKLKDI